MSKRPTFGIIGIPTFGKVSIDWALNFHMLGVGLAVYVGYHLEKNKRVDTAKNLICERAVNDGADWVFLLDDDVIPPTNTIMKMIKMAFGPPYLDIINGVYFSKSEPPIPLMFRGDLKGAFWNWHVGDLVKIDAAGAGCTFIKTKVLKALPKPWFSTEYSYNPEDPNDFPPPAAGATEDLYFYKKVREAGFQVWADTSIQCIHENRNVDPPVYYGLPDDYPQAIKGSDIKPRGEKLILDIGAGEHSPYFPEGVPVRLDYDETFAPDIVCDWNHIPEPDLKYDIVYASHALEHNPFKRVLNVLDEWTRVLKVGGELRLIVPNLQYVAEKIAQDKPLNNQDMWVLYSAQKNEHDYHMTGFTPNLLKEAVEKLGTMADVKVWTSDGNWSNWQQWPGKYNILLTATKKSHKKTASIADESLANYSPEESELQARSKYEVGKSNIVTPNFDDPKVRTEELSEKKEEELKAQGVEVRTKAKGRPKKTEAKKKLDWKPKKIEVPEKSHVLTPDEMALGKRAGKKVK